MVTLNRIYHEPNPSSGHTQVSIMKRPLITAEDKIHILQACQFQGFSFPHAGQTSALPVYLLPPGLFDAVLPAP